MLPKMMMLFFNFRCIDALEEALVNKAVMVGGEQIKNVGWKQQVLINLNGTILKLWLWHLA